jgi:hypothetical protein
VKTSFYTARPTFPQQLHKRKGHPATGRPSLQGRIVPTEARPSKLSGQILGFRKVGVKRFLGLKLFCFQQLAMTFEDLWEMAEISPVSLDIG